MTRFLFICLFISRFAFAGDTLFTHPMYPPIVYEPSEFDFYKYTPKYIPDNMLHCFKMLGTIDEDILKRFAKRSVFEVIERGIFDRGYRTRREFCLYSYSRFTQYFHSQGIYSPFAMETFILLSFHQYLNQSEINWKENKKMALQDLKPENRSWRSRANKLYHKFAKHRRRTEKELKKIEADEQDFFYMYGDESWQEEKPRKLKRKIPD